MGAIMSHTVTLAPMPSQTISSALLCPLGFFRDEPLSTAATSATQCQAIAHPSPSPSPSLGYLGLLQIKGERKGKKDENAKFPIPDWLPNICVLYSTRQPQHGLPHSPTHRSEAPELTGNPGFPENQQNCNTKSILNVVFFFSLSLFSFLRIPL